MALHFPRNPLVVLVSNDALFLLEQVPSQNPDYTF